MAKLGLISALLASVLLCGPARAAGIKPVLEARRIKGIGAI